MNLPKEQLMLPIVIDVEASGFGRESYPIEVGLVLADGTPHCFLVAPERSWTHWDPAAEALHGISRATLEAHGRPAAEVAWRLNELLRGKTVYTDAWSFDMSWLGKLFDAVHLQPTFELQPISGIMDERRLAGWDRTREQVMQELKLKRHRASGDARVLQETYRRLAEQAA